MKFFEIRDSGTFIATMAFRFDPQSDAARYLLARSGYGRAIEAQKKYVMLTRLGGDHPAVQHDPYLWGSTTMQKAHHYIEAHYDVLNDGEVIDVEYIMGTTAEKKISERFDGSFYVGAV